MSARRILLLMRHATADAGEGPDHARPLTPLGLAEARAVGEDWPGDLPWPDLALCSDARRTQETVKALGARRGFAAQQAESGLYLGLPERMIERIRAVPESVRCLLLVGHNPGIYQLALELVETRREEPHPEGAPMRALAAGFPPASLCAFFLPPGMDWAGLAPGTAELTALRRVREGWQPA